MKFSIKFSLLMLVAAALAFAACKDDDEKSAEELLTAASCWSPAKEELFNSTTNQWEDQGAVDDCTKDDCTKFNSDKTASFDEGATKCDPSDPQTSEGTWSLSADGKTLTGTIGGDTSSGTIVELTSSKLVLEYDFFGIKFRSTLEAN